MKKKLANMLIWLWLSFIINYLLWAYLNKGMNYMLWPEITAINGTGRFIILVTFIPSCILSILVIDYFTDKPEENDN